MTPTSVMPTATSTITVNTSTNTPPGSYPVTSTGTSTSGSHSTTLNLTVKAPAPPPPDFGISANQASVTVTRGSSGSDIITITALNGSNSVNLSVTGLPSRTTAAFSPNPVSVSAPNSGTSTLSITVSRKASPGKYPLTITGNNGSVPHSTAVALIIN